MLSIGDIIRQKSFSTARQKVIINLVYSGGWAKSMSTKHLKPFKLSWQQFNLMRILKGQQGKPVPLRLLAERMLDPQSNASRIVDKLVEKGLVDRVTCSDDRRQVRLTLSQQGVEHLNAASAHIEKENQKLGGDLSEEELHQLSDLLDRFRNSH